MAQSTPGTIRMSRTALAAEDNEGFLVGRAVVRGAGVLDGVERDEHGAGLLPRFVGLLGEASGDEGAPGGP